MSNVAHSDCVTVCVLWSSPTRRSLKFACLSTSSEARSFWMGRNSGFISTRTNQTKGCWTRILLCRKTRELLPYAQRSKKASLLICYSRRPRIYEWTRVCVLQARTRPFFLRQDSETCENMNDVRPYIQQVAHPNTATYIVLYKWAVVYIYILQARCSRRSTSLTACIR
jgi:hypothetical protein